jgi:LysR family transcriptional regulator, regulator of abg operon
MHLKQIYNFVTVVEAGSIRAAARKLGVSQPAITKSVRSLEAELQAQLVQRTPHGVVPTPSGRAFFERARVAQAELRKAEEEATRIEGEGSVAFGVGPVAALLVAPEAVARFRQQFPTARVRVVEGLAPALLPLVRNATLDFAMGPRLDARLDPVFAFRPLYRAEHLVVARKGHRLRNARALAELADADWLNLTGAGQSSDPLDRMFSSAGLLAPRRVVQCESYNTIVAMVAKTDMLAIIARLLLAEPFARSVLEEIAIAEPAPTLNVGMFTRADAPLTPAAAAMAKAVTAATRALVRSP